ncbi:MAG: DciA family protein [Candidatus Limnocylindrales bacterium]
MTDDQPRRRRPMSRIGDLMPGAAAHLGLEDELRRARFLATFDAIVAELVPAAHGACRALRVEGETLFLEADAPIVGQELVLHGDELAGAFRRAPGGAQVRLVRVTIRRH